MLAGIIRSSAIIISNKYTLQVHTYVDDRPKQSSSPKNNKKAEKRGRESSSTLAHLNANDLL